MRENNIFGFMVVFGAILLMASLTVGQVSLLSVIHDGSQATITLGGTTTGQIMTSTTLSGTGMALNENDYRLMREHDYERYSYVTDKSIGMEKAYPILRVKFDTNKIKIENTESIYIRVIGHSTRTTGVNSGSILELFIWDEIKGRWTKEDLSGTWYHRAPQDSVLDITIPEEEISRYIGNDKKLRIAIRGKDTETYVDPKISIPIIYPSKLEIDQIYLRAEYKEDSPKESILDGPFFFTLGGILMGGGIILLINSKRQNRQKEIPKKPKKQKKKTPNEEPL